MERYLKALQRGIIYFTLFIISLLLILALIDVFIKLYDGLINNPLRTFIELQYPQLIDLFLVIIIGVELLETIKGFLRDEILHVELVVLVAIIAISRKVIVWGISKTTSQEMFSLAAMLAALALTYWVIKTCYKKKYNKLGSNLPKANSSCGDVNV
ncbi:MAG TPA: phosphate-starvation-inducible PsiE family protein [Tenuifilum sp.]|uniref:phosphate-starvation-inducible PsiE family protein n=1 Tax=Tenuifilum sp. TaxID=2760880 RepID=UPI002C84C92D|nr:phosphate-starvation-inducible PsiE family protein [Tenuifilum sp.]HQG73587.1 phosphate-starvation-inducible PsiE family protein [Tenuifilum sp.]